MKPWLAIGGIILAASTVAPADATQPSEWTVQVKSVQGSASARLGQQSWTPLAADARLAEGAEIRTDAKGVLGLVLPEGSEVQIRSKSEIVLEALHDATNQPLIQVLLKRGEIRARVDTGIASGGRFAVHTDAASVFAEGPAFSVSYDATSGLTTIAVEDGAVFVQPDVPGIYPINLSAGEQVSLDRSTMGPVVAAGAPPSLTEPALPHALLDLGSWEECETSATEICGSWRWNRKVQQFDAAWHGGAQAAIKVERMGGGEIVLTRIDSDGASAGLTARYVGRSEGSEILGEVAFQVIAGTVTWSWRGTTSSGTWRALSSYLLDLGEPQPAP